jgi:antitoxin component of MazEF toxin-antitoxin module
MEKEYSVKRKVYRQGGSLLISLPKIWVDREGIKEGDKLQINFDSFRGLKVSPTK